MNTNIYIDMKLPFCGESSWTKLSNQMWKTFLNFY